MVRIAIGPYGHTEEILPPPDDKGGYTPNREWPPPSETPARLRELTERMNAAASDEYVWTPSLINKFVLCLKADRRAREILARLLVP